MGIWHGSKNAIVWAFWNDWPGAGVRVHCCGWPCGGPMSNGEVALIGGPNAGGVLPMRRKIRGGSDG